MEQVNIFGKGYIGSHYLERYPDSLGNERGDYTPKSKNILYFISTTDNYSVLTDPFIDINTNLVTLLTVLNNIRDRENVVFNFISSWFVYGDTDLPATEASHCKPKGFYSITKRTAEELLISYCETFGIKYRILRLANVVGGQSTFSTKKNALEYMVNELKHNREVNLYEGGKLIRDFIHIDDCVTAINLVITKGKVNEIYNISNGIPISLVDYITRIQTRLESTSVITPIPTPQFHRTVQVESMYLDNSKITELGYVPEFIDDALITKIISKL